MSLIPALRRKRQWDLCEFEASLDYVEKPCLKKTTHTHKRETGVMEHACDPSFWRHEIEPVWAPR